MLPPVPRNAGAVILKMAYDYEVKEDNDELVELVDKSIEGFIVATTPGAFLVDLFPICMLFDDVDRPLYWRSR